MTNTALGLTLLVAVTACGCASKDSEVAFGKTITDAKASLTSGLSYSQKLQLEQELSNESKKFLKNRRSIDSFRSDCTTDLSKETLIAQKRLDMFRVTEIYFNKMEKELNDNIDYTAYVAEVGNIESSIKSLSIPGVSTAADLAVIKTVAESLAKAGNAIQTQRDLIRISQIARKLAPQLKKVVGDIESGLLSSQTALNSYVKTWEQCEYERLQIIYAHENANPAEVSALFEAFRVKLATLKAQKSVIIDSRDLLKKVVEANDVLAEPQLTLDRARAAAAGASEIYKNIKSAMDSAEKL